MAEVKHRGRKPAKYLARLRPTLYLGPCPPCHRLGLSAFFASLSPAVARLDLIGFVARGCLPFASPRVNQLVPFKAGTTPSADSKGLESLRSPMNKSQKRGVSPSWKTPLKRSTAPSSQAVVYQYFFIVSSPSSLTLFIPARVAPYVVRVLDVDQQGPSAYRTRSRQPVFHSKPPF